MADCSCANAGNDQLVGHGGSLFLDLLDLAGFVEDGRQKAAAVDRLLSGRDHNIGDLGSCCLVAMRGNFRQWAKFHTLFGRTYVHAAEQKNNPAQPYSHKTGKKLVS